MFRVCNCPAYYSSHFSSVRSPNRSSKGIGPPKRTLSSPSLLWVPGRFDLKPFWPNFVRPKRLQYVSVATLFRFVARFARVRIEDSSRNRFALNGIQRSKRRAPVKIERVDTFGLKVTQESNRDWWIHVIRTVDG